MNWFGICAWLAVAASGTLVTSGERKTRLFALFALYLMGGMACLLSGATMLGFALWMVGVLLALAVLVHVPVFGNRDEVVAAVETAPAVPAGGRANLKRLSPVLITVLVTIGAGLFGLSGADAPAAPAGERLEGVVEFSRQMMSKDWLKLELVGILLLVSVVGAGVTTRAERLSSASGRREKKA